MKAHFEKEILRSRFLTSQDNTNIGRKRMLCSSFSLVEMNEVEMIRYVCFLSA